MPQIKLKLHHIWQPALRVYVHIDESYLGRSFCEKNAKTVVLEENLCFRTTLVNNDEFTYFPVHVHVLKMFNGLYMHFDEVRTCG